MAGPRHTLTLLSKVKGQGHAVPVWSVCLFSSFELGADRSCIRTSPQSTRRRAKEGSVTAMAAD